MQPGKDEETILLNLFDIIMNGHTDRNRDEKGHTANLDHRVHPQTSFSETGGWWFGTA
jgi:hypothetical protein